MENDPITFEHATWIVSMLVVCAAVIGWFEGRIAALRKEVHDLKGVTSSELHEYKLEVSDRYASVTHLKEVESRLASAIDRLTARLDTLPAALAAELRRHAEHK
ncbi:MAG: hypothetical protein ACK562_15590 [Acidobacteriota bacterium]|jgi:hypothetical protein